MSIWKALPGTSFGAPGSRAGLERVAVMKSAVEYGGGHRHVIGQFAPAHQGTIFRQGRPGNLFMMSI